MKISIGADPEVFLTYNGKIVSAIGVISGTKDNPHILSDAPGAIQVDNVLAEFNIDPATSPTEFCWNIQQVMRSVKNSLPEGYGFTIQASHSYDLNYLLSIDDERVFMFGCDPDYDAWTGRVKEFPSNTDPTLRSAGGHIHIGFRDKTISKRDVVRMLDYLIGLPSVIMDPDKKRRALYGQAGSYRMKKYGIEYRTPSNFWIRDEKTMRWVFTQATRAVLEVRNLEKYIRMLPPDALIYAINSSDATIASKFMEI